MGSLFLHTYLNSMGKFYLNLGNTSSLLLIFPGFRIFCHQSNGELGHGFFCSPCYRKYSYYTYNLHNRLIFYFDFYTNSEYNHTNSFWINEFLVVYMNQNSGIIFLYLAVAMLFWILAWLLWFKAHFFWRNHL